MRDLNTRRLGITQRALYGMLLAIPLRVPPAQLSEMLSAAHRERFRQICGSHQPPEAYDIRSATLFCIAECARSEAFAGLLSSGRLDEVGLLMNRSHDAERVAALADGRCVPYSWQATDDYVNSLVTDLESEDPERVRRAQLRMQPGRYGCGAPEIDEMVDLARSVEGVVGAQLSGVGIAGCIMVLLEAGAVGRLKQALKARFYDRHKMRPDITVCTPVASADLVRT
jgi:galactokinase